MPKALCLAGQAKIKVFSRRFSECDDYVRTIAPRGCGAISPRRSGGVGAKLYGRRAFATAGQAVYIICPLISLGEQLNCFLKALVKCPVSAKPHSSAISATERVVDWSLSRAFVSL